VAALRCGGHHPDRLPSTLELVGSAAASDTQALLSDCAETAAVLSRQGSRATDGGVDLLVSGVPMSDPPSAPPQTRRLKLTIEWGRWSIWFRMGTHSLCHRAAGLRQPVIYTHVVQNTARHHDERCVLQIVHWEVVEENAPPVRTTATLGCGVVRHRRDTLCTG
jgi:hypothetical protein